MPVLQVFADESCTTAHRHMVFGAIAMDEASYFEVTDSLTLARVDARLTRELKWAKVSKAMFGGYRAILNAFFDLAQRDTLHFHAMHVDTTTIRHGSYSGGDEEMGFNKLIYQLLLHRIGKYYGRHYEIEVYLDDRTHTRNPNEMTAMLNADVARRWNYINKPFRFVKFRDSKESDLIQIADILAGAIGFRKNDHHKRPGAAKHKCELALHIGSRAIKLEKRGLADIRARRFTLWNFQYRKGGGSNA